MSYQATENGFRSPYAEWSGALFLALDPGRLFSDLGSDVHGISQPAGMFVGLSDGLYGAGSGLRMASPAATPPVATASRGGVKPDVGTDLRNCASNTDLAAHFAGQAGRSQAPSPLRPTPQPLRGEEASAAADADRVSGLQLPATGGSLAAVPRYGPSLL